MSMSLTHALEGARCASPNVDPEMWFSDEPFEQLKAQVQCLVCPVMHACLAFGQREPFGIYGGLTADMRKRNREAPDKTTLRWRDARGALDELLAGRRPSAVSVDLARRVVRMHVRARVAAGRP